MMYVRQQGTVSETVQQLRADPKVYLKLLENSMLHGRQQSSVSEAVQQLQAEPKVYLKRFENSTSSVSKAVQQLQADRNFYLKLLENSMLYGRQPSSISEAVQQLQAEPKVYLKRFENSTWYGGRQSFSKPLEQLQVEPKVYLKRFENSMMYSDSKIAKQSVKTETKPVKLKPGSNSSNKIPSDDAQFKANTSNNGHSLPNENINISAAKITKRRKSTSVLPTREESDEEEPVESQNKRKRLRGVCKPKRIRRSMSCDLSLEVSTLLSPINREFSYKRINHSCKKGDNVKVLSSKLKTIPRSPNINALDPKLKIQTPSAPNQELPRKPKKKRSRFSKSKTKTKHNIPNSSKKLPLNHQLQASLDKPSLEKQHSEPKKDHPRQSSLPQKPSKSIESDKKTKPVRKRGASLLQTDDNNKARDKQPADRKLSTGEKIAEAPSGKVRQLFGTLNKKIIKTLKQRRSSLSQAISNNSKGEKMLEIRSSSNVKENVSLEPLENKTVKTTKKITQRGPSNINLNEKLAERLVANEKMSGEPEKKIPKVVEQNISLLRSPNGECEQLSTERRFGKQKSSDTKAVASQTNDNKNEIKSTIEMVNNFMQKVIENKPVIQPSDATSPSTATPNKETVATPMDISNDDQNIVISNMENFITISGSSLETTEIPVIITVGEPSDTTLVDTPIPYVNANNCAATCSINTSHTTAISTPNDKPGSVHRRPSIDKSYVKPRTRNLPLLNQTQQVNDLQNLSVIVGENLSSNTPVASNCSAMPVGQSNNTPPQIPSTRYIEEPHLNGPALTNLTITPVVKQNLGSIAASNVGQSPQRTFFENMSVSPPAPYLRQTTVASVANENYNNQLVVGPNNNQGIVGPNNNQVGPNNYQGVFELTNNNGFVGSAATTVTTHAQFANAFTMQILTYIDACELKNQFMDVCRNYGMTEEVLVQEFSKFYDLVLHEKLKQFSDHLVHYLNIHQVKNFQLKKFLLLVDKCANKNFQRSIYTRHVVWVLLEALDPYKNLCTANTELLKEVYFQSITLWQEDVQNMCNRRAQAGTLMSEAQKEMFYQQCQQYYKFYMALWGNQAHQPQQNQQLLQSSGQLRSSPSIQAEAKPHLQSPVLSQDYPPVQLQQLPCMSSDAPPNQFSSSVLQHLNQQIQSNDINLMPPNHNAQDTITSEPITTISTFVLSVPQAQTNMQNISLLQTPQRSAHIAAPFSPTFSHYSNDDFRICLPLLKLYEPPRMTGHVTAASETVPIPASAAKIFPAAQDTSSLSHAISDCIDKVIRQTFAVGTGNNINQNENSDSIEQKDEEVDENIIDVDKWYAENMMTEDVVCLNPVYFDLNHFIKTDFDVKIRTDTEETPDFENNQEVGIEDRSGTEQAEPEPQQQQQLMAVSKFAFTC